MLDHGREINGMLNKWQEGSVLKELEELIQVEQHDGDETGRPGHGGLEDRENLHLCLVCSRQSGKCTTTGLRFGKLTWWGGRQIGGKTWGRKTCWEVTNMI